VLTAAMENPKVPWSARITAAGMIADRVFGRAPQSVSLEVTRWLNDLTLDELRQLEAKLAGEQLTIDITPTETPSATGGREAVARSATTKRRCKKP
jgi:hypothetical protein